MPILDHITSQSPRLTSTTAPAVVQHLLLEFAPINTPTIPRGVRVKLASHSQVAYLSGSRTTTSTPKTAAAPEKARPVFPSVRSTPTPTFTYLLLPPSAPHDIPSHLTYLKLGLPCYSREGSGLHFTSLLHHHTYHTPIESLPVTPKQRICAPEKAPDLASTICFQFDFDFSLRLCVQSGVFDLISTPSLSGVRQTGVPFALCTCSGGCTGGGSAYLGPERSRRGGC